MTKLCIIGAGSAVFTKTIVTDILLIDEFKNIIKDLDKYL